MLNLRHKLYWNWPHLYARLLLAHQSIHNIQYLISEAGLAYCAYACCSRERPKDKHSDRAYGCLVDPFLLTNHCQCTAADVLERYG